MTFKVHNKFGEYFFYVRGVEKVIESKHGFRFKYLEPCTGAKYSDEYPYSNYDYCKVD